MTVSLFVTQWDSSIDAAELLELADIADSHGLTDEAAQLRQAAEDIETHTEYTNDLARLVGGEGNPFSGISEDSDWIVGVTANYTHTVFAPIDITYIDAKWTPEIDVDATYNPRILIDASYIPRIIRDATYTPRIVSEASP